MACRGTTVLLLYFFYIVHISDYSYIILVIVDCSDLFLKFRNSAAKTLGPLIMGTCAQTHQCHVSLQYCGMTDTMQCSVCCKMNVKSRYRFWVFWKWSHSYMNNASVMNYSAEVHVPKYIRGYVIASFRILLSLRPSFHTSILWIPYIMYATLASHKRQGRFTWCSSTKTSILDILIAFCWKSTCCINPLKPNGNYIYQPLSYQ
jgi:hypothetical protein